MTSSLDVRLTALRAAASLARGRADDAAIDAADTVVARAGDRLGLGLEATVAALAGPTGAGKSTLFNALAGDELSVPGHRRPTTSTATAAVWGEVGDDLLTWLEVPRRHRRDGDPDGLVLLDLPDFDSVAPAHRREADRVIELADLSIWVLDPQKYADGVIHERYLRPLANRRDAMLVVLNQVDRLAPAARAACIEDLRRLLAEDGLGDVPVVAVSALSGEGIDALRAELTARVGRRQDALARIGADATQAARTLAEASGLSGEPDAIRREDERHLVSSLADAAGVPSVLRAVRRAHRRRGALSTGWPVVRGLRRLRPDPLRRLHLSERGDDGTGVVARSSIAPAGGVQAAQVASAARAVADRAAGSLAEPWPRLLRTAALRNEARLPELLDEAVAGADLRMREPLWWRLVGGLQWLLLVASVVGGLWLLALAALGFLHLEAVVPTPEYEQLPVPTLLLVGGTLAGVLVALLAGFFNRFGASRRQRVAERAILARVGAVSAEHVVAPLRAELDARKHLQQHLQSAADAGTGARRGLRARRSPRSGDRSHASASRT